MYARANMRAAYARAMSKITEIMSLLAVKVTILQTLMGQISATQHDLIQTVKQSEHAVDHVSGVLQYRNTLHQARGHSRTVVAPVSASSSSQLVPPPQMPRMTSAIHHAELGRAPERTTAAGITTARAAPSAATPVRRNLLTTFETNG